MPVTVKERGGKSYVFGDFSNQSGPACIATLDELAKVVRMQPGKVRILTDMTGAAVGPDVMAHAKELGKAVFEPRAERQAMLGVDGLKKMLLGAYMKFTGGTIRPCANEREALDYLLG